MLLTNKRDSNLGAALARIDRSSATYRVVLTVVLLLTVTLVFSYFMSLVNWEPNQWQGLTGMLNGTAWKPYVTRVLVPLLTRLIVWALPIQPQLVVTAWMFLSLVGFVFAFRYLTTAFWPPSILTDALSVLAIVALLPLIAPFSRQIYDFTTLFFFTLELALLARREWKWFLVIFPLACLNRETTFLLSLVFALHYGPRVERRFLVTMLAAQALIYIAIRAPLMWLFKDNPGDTLVNSLAIQLSVLAQIFTFSVLGWVALMFLLLGLAMLGLMLYRWRTKPPFLRDSAIATVPLLAVSYMLFGMPFEIRVFYEAFPAVFLLCMHPTLARLSLEMGLASG